MQRIEKELATYQKWTIICMYGNSNLGEFLCEKFGRWQNWVLWDLAYKIRRSSNFNSLPEGFLKIRHSKIYFSRQMQQFYRVTEAPKFFSQISYFSCLVIPSRLSAILFEVLAFNRVDKRTVASLDDWQQMCSLAHLTMFTLPPGPWMLASFTIPALRDDKVWTPDIFALGSCWSNWVVTSCKLISTALSPATLYWTIWLPAPNPSAVCSSWILRLAVLYCAKVQTEKGTNCISRKKNFTLSYIQSTVFQKAKIFWRVASRWRSSL